METWWQGLGFLNKGFFIAAGFFSLLFLWQLISTLIGLDHNGGGHDGDISVDHGDFAGDASLDHGDFSGDVSVDHGEIGGDHVAHQLGGDITFSLVSIRSILAFGMLFSWSGALYLMGGTYVVLALLYSFAWGLVAMLSVSYLIYKLVQLQETGTMSIWTALGEEGTVYINVPPEGEGRVRVMVSGAVSYVKARSTSDKTLEAGARVRVCRIIDDNTVEVEPMENSEGEQDV